MLERLGYSPELGLHIMSVDELYSEAKRYGKKAQSAPPHSSERAKFANKAAKLVKMAYQAKQEVSDND